MRPVFIVSLREGLPAKAWRQHSRRKLLAAADWLVVGSEYSADEARHLHPMPNASSSWRPGSTPCSSIPAHVGPERITTLARQWQLQRRAAAADAWLDPRPRGHELFVDRLARSRTSISAPCSSESVRAISPSSAISSSDQARAGLRRARLHRRSMPRYPGTMMLADASSSTSRSPLYFSTSSPRPRRSAAPSIADEHGRRQQTAARRMRLAAPAGQLPVPWRRPLNPALRYPRSRTAAPRAARPTARAPSPPATPPPSDRRPVLQQQSEASCSPSTPLMGIFSGRANSSLTDLCYVLAHGRVSSQQTTNPIFRSQEAGMEDENCGRGRTLGRDGDRWRSLFDRPHVRRAKSSDYPIF